MGDVLRGNIGSPVDATNIWVELQLLLLWLSKDVKL